MPDYCREITIKAYVWYLRTIVLIFTTGGLLCHDGRFEREKQGRVIFHDRSFEIEFLIVVNIIIVPSHRIDIFKNNKSINSLKKLKFLSQLDI